MPIDNFYGLVYIVSVVFFDYTIIMHMVPKHVDINCPSWWRQQMETFSAPEQVVQ